MCRCADRSQGLIKVREEVRKGLCNQLVLAGNTGASCRLSDFCRLYRQQVSSRCDDLVFLIVTAFNGD